MSESAVETAQQVTVAIEEQISAEATAGKGVRSFRLNDFVVKVEGHSYVAPVKDCYFYLDPRGVWILTYTLENSQWRGNLVISMRVANQKNEDVSARIPIAVELVCHNHSGAVVGPFPVGSIDAVARVSFTYSAKVRAC